MDVEKLIKTLRQHGVSCVRACGRYCSICDEAATALSTLQAENAQLRAELEQVTLENNALWTYIEIVDREYRRYMDRGYIDRLDELKRTWRRSQKED